MTDNDKTMMVLAGVGFVAFVATLMMQDDGSTAKTPKDNPYQKDFENVDKLFREESYPNAVTTMINILCQVIRDKSGQRELDGTKLVNDVFGKSGNLKFDLFPNQPNIDGHDGYTNLCRGVMQGFRNSHAHANLILEKEEAQWQIQLIAHLADAVAKKTKPNNAGKSA